MKRTLSFILAVVMVISMFAGLQTSSSALEPTGQCGENVTYTFNSSTGLLTISGTGYMYNYTSASNCPFNNQTSIKTVVINSGVTNIGIFAFYGCSGLTSITIPDFITSIGYGAFCGCRSLTNITIPDSVTGIGNSAFESCSGLKELTMPCSAKIDNRGGTFGGCTNIEKVTLTKGTGTMQNYGTSTSYSGTDTNYQYTPWYISRDNLKEILIEDGITNIGAYAFKDCTGLTSINIPDSVTSIGDSAFDGCSGLTDVNYTGTQDQWNAIIIDKSNEDLTDASIQYDYVPPHVHSYTDVVTPPTCTAKGFTTHTCACGDSYKDTYVNALGHDMKKTEAKAATCTEAGNREYYHCSRCKKYFTDDKGNTETTLAEVTIAARGHDYTEWEVLLPATCGKAGLKSRDCKYNDIETEYIIIPATGEHTWRLTATTTPATCGENGVGEYTCSVCGATKTDSIPATSEHTWELTATTTPATCTADGSGEYTCSVCKETKTDTIPKLAHTPGKAVKENEVPATCTKAGSYDEVVYCSVCKAQISRKAKTIKAAHKWDNGKVTKKATPTATGIKTYTCKVCKAKKTEKIAKCAKYKNTLSVKGKKVTVKYSKLKKSYQILSRNSVLSVTKAKGTLSYSKASGNKNIGIHVSTGMIMVKKGLKKGTYKVVVKVTAAGNATYKSATKKATITVVVK